jgi:cation:H+ antiporter
MWDWIALAGGILLLYFGAEWLVKGAAGLGRAFGVRPIVVGLTVIAYGTSMPELVVSGIAAVNGMPGIALGNVIGSNIANLGLILGVTAAISPLVIDGQLIRRELPVMLITTLLIPLLVADGAVERWEALLLVAGAVAFTYITARFSRPDTERFAQLEADAEAVGAPRVTGKGRLAVIAFVGLVLLIAGGHFFVTGASAIAMAFGISERIVGLTVAAIGTSAPELAASVVAALRGHASMAVGNVIGSNIFNVVFVLGGVGVLRPIKGAVENFGFDVAVLVGITLLAMLFLRGARTMVRWEGVALLIAYAAYLLALVVM